MENSMSWTAQEYAHYQSIMQKSSQVEVAAAARDRAAEVAKEKAEAYKECNIQYVGIRREFGIEGIESRDPEIIAQRENHYRRMMEKGLELDDKEASMVRADEKRRQKKKEHDDLKIQLDGLTSGKPVDDPQLTFEFDDSNEEITALDLPANVIAALNRESITTVDGLRRLVAGQNTMFPGGAATVEGIDDASASRIVVAIAHYDTTESHDPEEVKPIESEAAKPEDEVVEPVRKPKLVSARMVVTIPDLGSEGDTVTGKPRRDGTLLVTSGDAKFVLEEGEFVLV
jgi:hypothetical protein